MSIQLYKLTNDAVELNDLGITITGLLGTVYNLTDEQANNIYLSAVGGDLEAAINGTAPFSVPELVVVDPRVGYTGNLSQADSLTAIQSTNDLHYGIQGAKMSDLDDVSSTAPTAGQVLQLVGTEYVPVDPSTIASDISLDDLSDVIDGTAHTNGVPYIYKGDGTDLVVVDFSTDTDVIEAVEDIIGAAFTDGTDTTFVYSDAAGTMQVNVDDVFLRNTGDTLDSGTLTIASGAAIAVSSGATLTIADQPVNPTDAANKEYVDSVASGLDPKESVKAGTVTGVGGVYNPAGGTAGTGGFTGVDLTSNVIFDGVPAIDAFVVGDRILIKNQFGSVSAGEINSGGADYEVGDTLTVSGGTFTTAATFNVDAVDGSGVITAISLTDPGDYTVLPANPVATTTDSTAGAGATLDLTSSDVQNGIYVVTTAGASGALERAPDQNGDPAAEVSGGNYTFVENGTTLATSGWVLQGNGVLTLNVDPIVWVQFSESSSYTAGSGLALNGSVFSLDIDNLTSATITGADEIAFNDVSATNTTRSTTIDDLLTALDIPNGVTTDGIVINNGGTYSTVEIAVDGAGALDGLAIANADGTAGNPTIGLDINGLPVRSDAVDLADRLAVYNVTSGANEYYTVSEIANAGAANAFGVITGDTGTATADSPADTVAFTGTGITITATAGTNAAVSFALDVNGLTAGAETLVSTDTIAVYDGTATLKYTFADVIEDFDIATGIGSATGLLVADGSGNITAVDIAVSGAGAEAGLTITNGDGQAGNPTIGLDITGTAAAGENLAATDEIIVYNASASANEKMTGQELADGISNLISLPGGLAVTTIGGQNVLTLIDSTRSNKVLSVESTDLTWSENRLGNNEWLQIGSAVDSTSGYIMPLDATIVMVTAQTADDNNNTKAIDLYIDGVSTTAGIVDFNPAVNGENTYSDTTLNIDVAAGEKLQLRGASTGGFIEDVVVTLWVKWRGA
jgi:hypothetical protein